MHICTEVLHNVEYGRILTLPHKSKINFIPHLRGQRDMVLIGCVCICNIIIVMTASITTKLGSYTPSPLLSSSMQLVAILAWKKLLS